MPYIRCCSCGNSILMDSLLIPFKGDIACENCKNVMEVDIGNAYQGGLTKVKTKFPDPVEGLGEDIWVKLNEIEQNALFEASFCIGSVSYTASEFMSLRALESVSRRCYTKLIAKALPSLNWFGILDKLKEEKNFKPYSNGIDYFRNVRNKIAHLNKMSSELDANSTYNMALRLIKELIGNYLP